MGLKSLFARYWKNRRGNIAIITALMIIPIGMVSAGVVDYGRFYAAKSAAQTALDAATLAAGASESTDVTQLTNTATRIFNQDIAGTAAAGAAINGSLAYNSTLHQITATASGPFTPMFPVFDMISSSQTFNVQTQTLMQTAGTLEVALVLDNTYSMSQPLPGSTTAKLAQLKTAALGLVSTVMTTSNQGNVKIGVVPYGDYVDVGVANRSASWLNIPADYSTSSTSTPSCTKTTTTCTGQTTTTCTSTSTHDGVTTTTTSSCKTGGTCTSTTAQLNPCPSPVTTVTNYKWYGCVLPHWGGSGIAMPQQASAYTSSTAYTAPALTTSSNCLTAITPLSTSSTTVNAAINAMVDQVSSYYPNTYIPGGLLWGINILAPAFPLSQGAAYDPNNKQPRKVIVLMTDGFNTDYLTSSGFKGVGTAGGTTAQEATAYSDEQALCNYAKSKNIEIYTIGVGVTDATSLSNLQSCATQDGNHYFDATSDAGLIAAFNVIAAALQNLRLSS